MIFKDSFSIFSKNINLLFKVLIYAFVLLLISMAIFVAIVNPIIKEFSSSFDFAEKLNETVQEWLSGEMGSFKDFFNHIGDVIDSNSKYLNILIGYTALFYFFLKFSFSVVFLPMAKVINSQMSLNYTEKYFRAMVFSLGRSLGFASIFALITVPLDIGMLIGGYYLIKILYSSFGVFSFTIVISLLILLFSMRMAIISQWIPIMACEDKKVFRALKESFKQSAKSYKKVLPPTIMLVLGAFAIFNSTALLTFGIIPIILIPAVLVLLNATNLIAYYMANNKKYYKN